MPTTTTSSATPCGVCGQPSVSTLVVGAATLSACPVCAQRLIDGDFVYATRAPLQLRPRSLQSVGEGPVAFPLRALH
jgi:hypothetical protein